MKRGLLLFFVLLLPFVYSLSFSEIAVREHDIILKMDNDFKDSVELFDSEHINSFGYVSLNCPGNICNGTTEYKIKISDTKITKAGSYIIQLADSEGNVFYTNTTLLNVQEANFEKCSDGTPYNECSTNRPLFCLNGALVERCGKGTFTYSTDNLELGITTIHTTAKCGDCLTGACQADGSCMKEIQQTVSKQTVDGGVKLAGAEEIEQGCKTNNPSECASYIVKEECNACDLCVWTREKSNPEQCYAKCESLDPKACEGYDSKFKCSLCGLCSWDGTHCCPKGTKWDKSGGCSSEIKTKPNCADYDFDKDGDVGFSDSSALSEQQIDYNKDGKYSFLDKILFLWDINLFGSGGCVWSDNDLLTIALSKADIDKCDGIIDAGKKKYCYQVTIPGNLFVKEKRKEETILQSANKLKDVCDEKLEGDDIEICKYRVALFGGLCGNGVKDEGEECDGDELGGAGCDSLGFSGGELSCSLCKFDTSKCNSICGDNLIDQRKGEECDNTSLNGKTCGDFDFTTGDLGCTSNCKFDVSKCNNCGNALSYSVASGAKSKGGTIYLPSKTKISGGDLYFNSITCGVGNVINEPKIDGILIDACYLFSGSRADCSKKSVVASTYCKLINLGGVCDYSDGENFISCNLDCPETKDVVSGARDPYVWWMQQEEKFLVYGKYYTNGDEACKSKYHDQNAKMNICNSNVYTTVPGWEKYPSTFGLACKCSISKGVSYCGDGKCDYWRPDETHNFCSVDCPETKDVVSINDPHVWRLGSGIGTGSFRVCSASGVRDKTFDGCDDSYAISYDDGNEACEVKYDDPSASIIICNSNLQEHPMSTRIDKIYGHICKCKLSK